MSEATATPAATPAPAASAAPAATPAASPAAASTPVSAPAATPVATPEPVATPAAETAKPDAGKSTLQVMQEQFAAKEAEAAAAPAEETPAAEPVEKTPEQIAEEEAAALPVVDEVKPEEKTETDDDLPNFDDFDLDPIALAPKELATKIETDPALAAALEQNPELKNEIFGNARLAAETAEFKKVFGTPEEASVAAQGHAQFQAISSAMLGIQDGDVKTIAPVMSQMLEASALRGPNGELQYDENGALVTDGRVGKFLRNSFRQRMEIFADQFVKAGDEEGQAAVDILMERAGLRTPSSANEEEMSAEVRTQLEDVKTQREALAREKQERDAEAANTFHSTVNTRIDALMDRGISSILSRATGLNDFSRKTVEGNIRADLAKEIKNNSRFQDEMDQLERMPYGPERQKKHMAIATRYFESGLARVAAGRIAEAGASLTAKQQAQADKSAARAEAAKSEIRGALPTAKAAPVLNEKESLAKVESDLRKSLGRSPTNLELMSENLKRKQQTAA